MKRQAFNDFVWDPKNISTYLYGMGGVLLGNLIGLVGEPEKLVKDWQWLIVSVCGVFLLLTFLNWILWRLDTAIVRNKKILKKHGITNV